MDEQHVRAKLEEFGVPYQTWGTGNSKSFAHLAREIAAGESYLYELNGKLVRKADGVLINVYFAQRALILIETLQLFADGRRISRKTDGSIGEKFKPGELPCDAALRAFREELGIDDPKLPLIEKPIYERGPLPSSSFPGLVSHFTVHHFEVDLPERHFIADGYIERQSDKTTYFNWKHVPITYLSGN